MTRWETTYQNRHDSGHTAAIYSIEIDDHVDCSSDYIF